MTDTARTDANRLADSIADRMVHAIAVAPSLVDSLPVVVVALLSEYDRARTSHATADMCIPAHSVVDVRDRIDPVVWLTRRSCGVAVDRPAGRAG